VKRGSTQGYQTICQVGRPVFIRCSLRPVLGVNGAEDREHTNVVRKGKGRGEF